MGDLSKRAGAAAAATGGAVTGIAGVGLQSALAGAVVGGAVGSAVGSATSYTGNYLSEKILWQHDVKWDNGDFWAGVGKAAAIGAVSSGLMYGLSDRYALEVDRTVVKWGNRMGMLDRAAKAVSNGGIGTWGGYDVDVSWYGSETPVTGQSNFKPEENKIYLYKDDFVVEKKGAEVFDPDRFIYAAKHESMHYEHYTKVPVDVTGTTDITEYDKQFRLPSEAAANDLANYRYSRYWSDDLKNYIQGNYKRVWTEIDKYDGLKSEMSNFSGWTGVKY